MDTIEKLQAQIAALEKENAELRTERKNLNRALRKVSAAYAQSEGEKNYLNDSLEESQELALVRLVIQKPYVHCYFSDGSRYSQEMTENTEENQITLAVCRNILKRLAGVEPLAELTQAIRANKGKDVVELSSEKGLREWESKQQINALLGALGYQIEPAGREETK